MEKQRLGGQVEDPYRYLIIAMIKEIFRTIKCYYSNKGTKDELIEGKSAIRWTKNMGNLFESCAIASNKTVDTFHQMCIWKINLIKKEVREENEQASLAKQN